MTREPDGPSGAARPLDEWPVEPQDVEPVHAPEEAAVPPAGTPAALPTPGSKSATGTTPTPAPGTPANGSGTVLPHSRLDDAQGLLTGTLFAALGLTLFRQAGFVTGGTAGLGLLLGYATGIPFGAAFFALNLPFYWLAWRRVGKPFTVKTLAAVALLSVLAEAIPHWLTIGAVHPVFAALCGGLLIGAGLLMLFRHRASLGGMNVLVLWLQEHFGWRAGYVQLAIDLAILAAAIPVATLPQLAYSVLGAVAMNLTLAINHRAGRYRAV